MVDTSNHGRRAFLKEALVAGATVSLSRPAIATTDESSLPPAPVVQPPHSGLVALETQMPSLSEAPSADPGHIGNPGSDFMVDVMNAVDIDYVAAMPGSTFRGLHESIVTYGSDRKPAMIVCTHEEVSVAIAHGYAKVAGKPMACFVHSTVGLQHASMAIYNAWCDRVPMMVIAGNIADTDKRRNGIEWYHTAQDLGALVRDFTKWDDAPASLQSYAESFVRAYTMSVTPPMEPVLIVADAELQERPIDDPGAIVMPAVRAVSPPVAEPGALATAGRWLAGASSPVIAVDRAIRTPEGMRKLITLAETLNAPVIDLLARMNFPTNHYLNQSGLQRTLIAQADVILALEVGDLWGVTGTVKDLIGRPWSHTARPGVKVISITTSYLYGKSNMQDAQRYASADLPIAADAETSLPGLLAQIDASMTKERRSVIGARTENLKRSFDAMRSADRQSATLGWDASPISTARLSQEVWNVIRNENWALVSSTYSISRWPHRLWDFTEPHQFIGGEGGFGVGYGAPAAVGAALAHQKAGRIAVNIQNDGDLMAVPGALWTAAHHKIPLLTVMHNNRAYHQETMHVQRMASRRDRHPENGTVGTVLTGPDIDFSRMAQSMGMWAEGPISRPEDLGPSLVRALAIVKRGEPALVDVVTQPR
ncbi:thiamine pyrophosphate-binding protein [Paraburkholderia metrosideri]|uniref:Thiamine pyrophosphate-binding protein n=1 Tax=Paraburkholderia metrosideri TaxID=580937 RepID=A0ABW9DMV1_9BURK